MAKGAYEWVIVTHDRADFDAFGSQVAAALLFDQSAVLLSGKLAGPVREFFVLYRDILGVPFLQEPPEEASRLVVVDTQMANSLGKWREWVLRKSWKEIHIYDHHPKDADRMVATVEVIEGRGATVSLLLDRLRERGVRLTPEQATVFAIAIYTDTGNFVFPQTTARDLENAAYLLSAGARMDLLRKFTAFYISPSQQRALEILLENARAYRIFDQRLTFTHITMDAREANDLSILASKMFELIQPELLIVAVEFPDSVLVLGRSSVPSVSLTPLWDSLGGGGHSSAGSARVRGASVDEVRVRVFEILERILPRPVTAWDLMSFPVRGVAEDATVKMAHDLMVKYGHSGLVVYDSRGALVGIITRKDTDRALRHRFGRQTVRQLMSHPVITATSDTSLEDLRRLLVSHNIGRVPVISDTGDVIGIVTRNDLIRAEIARRSETIEGEMERPHLSQLPPEIVNRLKAIGETAQSLGFSAYLVGGPVRDLLMGGAVKDYDIVIEGDAGLVAENLCVDERCTLQRHGQFGTACVVFPDGLRVDLATAREEYYPSPGELPAVEPASLTADLRRRDFTVNGIALSLNPHSFGRIVDPYDGVADLRARRLRVFHTLSFVEDPTRILRAVRYQIRLGFTLEEHTAKLFRSAISARALRKVSGERVRAELERTFAEPRASQMLIEMDETGILDSIYRGWHLDHRLFTPENQVLVVTSLFPEAPKNTLYFLALLHGLRPHTALKVAQRLRLQRHELKAVGLMKQRETVLAKLRSADAPSKIYSVLSPLPDEFVFYLYVISNEERRSLDLYLRTLRGFRLKVTGEDLIQRGAVAGPRLGNALKRTLYLRMDNKIREDEELETAVRIYFSGANPEGFRRQKEESD